MGLEARRQRHRINLCRKRAGQRDPQILLPVVRRRAERCQQHIPLDWVPCRFGGERPWFLCHGVQNGRSCDRRVRYLYGAGKLFACRHSYGLAYESQQEPARQRGLLKAQKIRERLGGNASMLDDFPNKPKGMHWRTHDRLQRRYEAADAQSPNDVDEVCRSICRTMISTWIGLQSPAYHVLNYVRPTRTCTRGSCGPGSCR